MILAHITREALLDHLPKGGRAAEIGVFRGDFSQHMLDRMAPEKLHLIDPWESESGFSTKGDTTTVYNIDRHKSFQHVQERFRDMIRARKVAIHRDYSHDVAPFLDDGIFGFVYVDGDHVHDAVLADLTLFAPKMADGGLLAGHDFTNAPRYAEDGYEVVGAVRDFRRENPEWRYLLLTLEEKPTFILTRDGGEAVLESLRNSGAELFEIEDLDEARFEHTGAEIVIDGETFPAIPEA